MGEWRYSSTIHSFIHSPFLTSKLDGGEESASHSCPFIHRKRAPSAHWMGHRAGLDTVKKRKIFCPCLESNLGLPAHTLMLYQLSYPVSKVWVNFLLKWMADDETQK
jgi:hypothetical protein